MSSRPSGSASQRWPVRDKRKAYVKYEDDKYELIGGSFRAGFGQRLIFDNSRHYIMFNQPEVLYPALRDWLAAETI